MKKSGVFVGHLENLEGVGVVETEEPGSEPIPFPLLPSSRPTYDYAQ